MFNPRLRGAKVQGGINARKNTNNIVKFATAIWDSDGYFISGDAGGFLKVPRRRLAGRYMIRVAVRWLNPWNPEFGPEPAPPFDSYFNWHYGAFIWVNGAALRQDARGTASCVPATKSTTINFSIDANLEKHDTIEVALDHSLDADATAEVWLEIRRLGQLLLESAP